jgi:hypothetical protein
MAQGDDERIDAQSDDDIRRWAKELGVGDIKLLSEAVRKVGPRVGDVRRHLDQQMAGGQADA